MFHLSSSNRLTVLVFAVSFPLVSAGCSKTSDVSNNPSLSAQEDAQKTLQQVQCNKVWEKASAAYEEWEKNPDPKHFTALLQALPKKRPPSGSSLCSNQESVMRGLGQGLDGLLKKSPGVHDFMVLLARLQPFSDGGIAEGICAQGPKLLDKDPRGFVQALHEEKEMLVDQNCLVLSARDLVDRPLKERSQAYQKRIAQLEKVKDENLQTTRQELTAALKQKIDTLKKKRKE